LLQLPVKALAGSEHNGLGDADAKVCFECHEDLATPPSKGSVHPPFAEGDCTTCHELTAKNKFGIIDMGDVFCYMCHDEKNTKAVVHAPVESGDCTMCHSPHQSPNASLLLESPVSKVCFTCHDEDEISKHKQVHAPVAGGECTSCHDPHESPNPKQLVEKDDALCLMCHMDKEDEIKDKKHVHGAIEMAGCTGCHSPHGSRNKYQLHQKPPVLCYDCHSDKEEKVKTPHGAVMDKKSCMNCHEPHASNFPAMTRDENIDLCLSCHNRKRKTPKGYVTNMKTLLEKNTEHHVPVMMGECSSCHNPHGSNEWRMLKGAFPSTFYTPFEVERYSLCFTCHEEELVLDKVTSSATGFRNGETNLHYVHVNDPKKGRRCAVCHDVHAAKGPKLIRETTAFGTWEFSHNFEAREDGGRCATGCHSPREYSRVKAVENP
jgi:predicted CXXCH cytochrome family protein